MAIIEELGDPFYMFFHFTLAARLISDLRNIKEKKNVYPNYKTINTTT